MIEHDKKAKEMLEEAWNYNRMYKDYSRTQVKDYDEAKKMTRIILGKLIENALDAAEVNSIRRAGYGFPLPKTKQYWTHVKKALG